MFKSKKTVSNLSDDSLCEVIEEVAVSPLNRNEVCVITPNYLGKQSN